MVESRKRTVRGWERQWIGDITEQKQYFSEYIFKEQVSNNQTLMDRVYEIVKDMGITLEEDIDWNSVLETLEFVFSPVISSFIPTAINILLFGGKRSLESDYMTGNLKRNF